jgi:hypothetical protein
MSWLSRLHVLEAGKKANAVRVDPRRSPNKSTALASVSVVGYFSELGLVDVSLTTLRTVQDHGYGDILAELCQF